MNTVQTPSTVVVPAERICPRCGAPLGGFGPEGLCGACLFDSGLAADESAAELDLLSSGSRRFGDYELIEEIDRGGMGVIFKARQVGLNRIVAVKLILRGEFAGVSELARFRAEAETAARLQHPNIVAIHEVGEREGQPFFSMDYIEGQNLAQLVGNTPLPAARAAKYVKTVAEAVEYAHQQGILHRDLKPSNVLIDVSDQPRVTDFGLAKRFGVPPSGGSGVEHLAAGLKSEPAEAGTPNDLTVTGQVLGSPNFMPPEQAAGKNDAIGPTSDVYSLGAILYHALTGRPPFVAESVTATLRLVAESEAVSPRLLVPSVPRDLETICLKCLEKNPQRRYATAQEMAEELNRFLRDEPIHARPIAPVEKLWRWCHRKPAAATAIVLLLVLVLVVAIGSPIAALRINRARQQAEAGQTQAKLEASKSQQVALFLKEMLRSAGPSVARGRDATVLREILEKTAGRVEKDLPDQPEVRGDLWLALGNTYRDIGDYPRAISMLKKAVDSYRLSLGDENIKLALALGQLGKCQSFNQEVPAGRANAELGLKIARHSGDPETLAICLMDMARSFAAWGMTTTDSVPCLREAQEIWQRLGNNPVAQADCLTRLGGTLQGSDNIEAEALVREGLALHRQHLEPNHPTVASDMFLLGQILMERGESEAAEKILRETYDLYREIYDQNHPHQPFVLRFLAESLLLQGKGDEAESLVRQQVSATPTNAGHLELLGILIGFRSAWAMDDEIFKQLKGDFLMSDVAKFPAEALASRGRWKEAEQLLREDLRRKRELYGPENVNLTGPIQKLAEVCVKQGKLTEAETLYREALVLLRKFLGSEDPYSVWPVYNLASVLRDQGKVAEAEAKYREALTLMNKVFGPENPAAPVTLNTLAALLRDQGSLSEAESLNREAEGLARKLPPSKDQDALLEWSLGDIGKTLKQQGKPDEAEEFYREALEISRKFCADNPFKTEVNVTALVDILRPKGRYGDVEKLFSDVLTPDLMKLPQSAGLLLLRADFFARRGLWNEAISDTTKSLERDNDNQRTWYELAPLLVASGDLAGYRKHCQLMLARFGATNSPAIAGTTAKACLLLPESGATLTTLASLADTGLTQTNGWSEFVKGLAEYRQGHFTNALEWTKKALAKPPLDWRDAQASMIMAMAHHGLNQMEDARTALAKGVEFVGANMPKLDGGDLGVNWQDVLIAHILMREAKALIEGNEAGGTDVFKSKD